MINLKKLNFTNEELRQLQQYLPSTIDLIMDYRLNVIENLQYLKEVGVVRYKEVLFSFPDVLFQDNIKLQEKFGKYQMEPLLELLLQDISLIEKL